MSKPTRPPRQRATATGVAVSLLLLACGQKASQPSQGGTISEEPTVAVPTAVTSSDQRPVTLQLDGTLVADEQSQVTAIVPGRVVAVMVERGTVVEENAPLIKLRDVDYRLQAQAAQTQLDQARARLGMADEDDRPPRPADLPDVKAAKSDAELAASNAARAEELAESGVLSTQALEEARARASASADRYQTALNGASAAVASLESARVALRQARTAASETVVRAPFAGEIANRHVSAGEYVGPQTPLVELVRTHPLRIELQVPQRYLNAVRQGAHVELKVDAVPDRTFDATVQYVSAAVRADTRALTVEAVVPNEDRMLRPGLFATARLSTGTDQEVTLAPASAVRTEAGVSRVFVVDHGKVEERIVSLGERSDDEVVILEGVAPGESVATADLDRISDGMTVVEQPATR